MEPESYGVLAQAVAVAGSLVSATTAIRLTWKGRFSWEPVEEDIPKGAQKIGGLLTSVCIALLWYSFFFIKSITDSAMIKVAALTGSGAFAALVIYSILVAVFVYDKEVVVGKNKTDKTKIIGGFWLTGIAKDALLKNPTITIPEVFKGAKYDPDKVWPRFSRALTKVSFQISYVALVGLGTLALSAASLLVASVLP